MRKPILAFTFATAAISGAALAQYPAGSPSGSTTSAPTSRTAPSPDAFDRQMKAMEEMHQKIRAAKTPAERSALMDEHRKLMQSGMTMMQQMRAGMHGMGPKGGMAPGKGMPTDSATRNQLMEKRMEMMEHMMQMMVDREMGMPQRP
jgi:hypothetical protein